MLLNSANPSSDRNRIIMSFFAKKIDIKRTCHSNRKIVLYLTS